MPRPAGFEAKLVVCPRPLSSNHRLLTCVRPSSQPHQVLDASPWVAPRPLFVLATQQPGRDAGLTYTLRTRVGRPDQEDELTSVLGGQRRPDGSPIIECAEVVDGVVAFEGEEAAGRFADLLEAGGALSEVRSQFSLTFGLYFS